MAGRHDAPSAPQFCTRAIVPRGSHPSPEVRPGTSACGSRYPPASALGAPHGPVKHLVATAESRDIVVAIRPLAEIDTVDAVSVVIVDRSIVITTPRRTTYVFKRRFSIACNHRDVVQVRFRLQRLRCWRVTVG